MTYIEPPPARSSSTLFHQNDYHSHQRERQSQVLTWLATLHAAYWQVTDETIQRLGLQPIGTYWHFATRQEEYRNMPDDDNSWQSRLKRAARAIDARLQRDPYQCVVHGDAKDENILYGRSRQNGDEPEQTVIYFCDFQYCGKGVPAQDLAYYFCSSCSSVDEEEEALLLDFYLQQLSSKVLRSNNHGGALPSVAPALPTRRELHDLMDLAHCDYYRFMCGWGFWGSGGNGGVDRVQRVLDRLDGGNKLASEELYDAAVRREYG
jgi:thiamine kinase-like enzyme